jgi:predicted kinase
VLKFVGGETSTLVVTRGLPASGKTTFARSWVAKKPSSRARLNRDETSSTLHGRSWGLTRAQEAAVTLALFGAIRDLLRVGFDVIVDDTNLDQERMDALGEAAADCGARLVVLDEFLQVPLHELIRRDTERRAQGRPGVGEAKIRQLYAEHCLRAEVGGESRLSARLAARPI